jgi:uncharacterized membrane protein
MAQVIEAIDVDVPVNTAYNQWTQFETFPHFLSMVQSITQIDDETMHWVVKIAGQEREFDAKVTEQIPDERVAWTSIGGDDKHAGVVTFHKLSDTTSRVTVQLDWEPQDALEKAGEVLGFDDRAIKTDMKNFKEFIEKRGTETGAWRGEIDN